MRRLKGFQVDPIEGANVPVFSVVASDRKTPLNTQSIPLGCKSGNWEPAFRASSNLSLPWGPRILTLVSYTANRVYAPSTQVSYSELKPIRRRKDAVFTSDTMTDLYLITCLKHMFRAWLTYCMLRTYDQCGETVIQGRKTPQTAGRARVAHCETSDSFRLILPNYGSASGGQCIRLRGKKFS